MNENRTAKYCIVNFLWVILNIVQWFALFAAFCLHELLVFALARGPRTLFFMFAGSGFASLYTLFMPFLIINMTIHIELFLHKNRCLPQKRIKDKLDSVFTSFPSRVFVLVHLWLIGLLIIGAVMLLSGSIFEAIYWLIRS